MLGFIRRNLLSGVLAITPLVLTVWVLLWIYGLIADKLRPLLTKLPYIGEHYPEFVLTLLGVGALVPLLVLLGVFARNLAGAAVFRLLDRVFDRIPVAKQLFGTFKQIAGVFEKERGRSFQEVVMVAFPHPGVYALAFVTHDDPQSGAVTVFLPTTPNPTSGFMLIVPRNEMKTVALTVEEAVKLVVSGGSIMSAEQMLELMPQAPEPDGAHPGECHER